MQNPDLSSQYITCIIGRRKRIVDTCVDTLHHTLTELVHLFSQMKPFVIFQFISVCSVESTAVQLVEMCNVNIRIFAEVYFRN